MTDITQITLGEADKVKLYGAVREACDSLTRQSGEVQFRKDVAERMKDELGISTSDFNALVREEYDDSCTEKAAKFQAIADTVEELRTSAKNKKNAATQTQTAS